jgi:signal transduction histidine kinase
VERLGQVRKRVQKQASGEGPSSVSLPVASESHSGGDDTDVTEFYQAVEFKHIVDAALINTTDAVIALKEDFSLVYLNPAAEALLGAPAQEAFGMPCMDVLRCKNLNRMVLCGTSSCPLRRSVEQKSSLPNEELILGIDPIHLFEVSASVNPVKIDETFTIVFTARDMSALKVASRVRSNFVSMVSHELRTPLNSVHGFIDLLLQGHMGDLTDEQRMYLGYTQEGVQQLISIVEDILFMTRADLGQFEVRRQEVHVLSLIRQVIHTLQPQAIKAEVVLTQDIPSTIPALFIDPQRIKQVLNNLVANAIKFTPPGGTVMVSTRRHDENFEMISVADCGYGIPIEDRQHVFERFYQSNHSQQSKMGGYGLGLSIAKLIVEQHGGAIGFDTVIDKGTTFYFTLPLYVPPIES